jgi:hypothetical protein
MMNDRDPLADALTALEVPVLDPRLAARVGVGAKAELRASRIHTLDVSRLRSAALGGLVPALLTLAALLETADAASTAVKIYGQAEQAASK